MARFTNAWVLGVLLCCGGCAQIVDPFLKPPVLTHRRERAMAARALCEITWGKRLQSFTYTGHDGLQLAALMLVPEGKPRGVAVLVHGLGDVKESMLQYAEVFAKAGYIAVAPDLRAHGQSQGKHTTFGYYEHRDMVALLDHLEKRGIDVSHVGVLGGSMGAATCLLWAGRDGRVKAVVAVAPFAELATIAEQVLEEHDVTGIKAVLAKIIVQAASGMRLSRVAPVEAVSRSGVSVYLLHGDNDDFIPPTESQRLFAAASGPVVLRRVPGAEHMDVADVAGDSFMREALEWIEFYTQPAAGAGPPGWTRDMPHRNMDRQ